MDNYINKLVLTCEETANWLRTSPEVVERLASEGRIPHVRLTPEEPPVFRPEDVIAFVENESGSQRRTGDVFGSHSPAFPPMPVPPAPPVPPVPPAPPVPPTASAPPAPRARHEGLEELAHAHAEIVRLQRELESRPTR